MQENIRILRELENLKGDDAPSILYCLLNRIPIIVSGIDSEKINEFISKLTYLIPFRNETIFGSVFNTQEELLNYMDEENTNYDSRRRTYISFCSSTPFALKTIKDFKSWILGIAEPMKKQKNIKQYLEISLKNKSITVNLIGLNKESITQEVLSFERKILSKFLEPEEIEKEEVYFNNFKNILLRLIKEEYLKVLADIQEEEEAIKLHLYRTGIQNFIAAAKKIYLLLSKIFFIDIKRENKEVKPPKLSKETLLDVVKYHDASIQRILSFIQEEFFGFAEYIVGVDKTDFSKYVDISVVGAKQDYLRRLGGL